MKNTMKKLLSLVLVAMLLVCAVPFQAAATEADAKTVKVNVYVDDVLTTDKTITVKSGESITLNEELAKSLVKSDKAFVKWTGASGNEANGQVIPYEKIPANYSVNLYVKKVVEDTRVDAKVPVKIYVDGSYVRDGEITVPVDGSVTLTKELGLKLVREDKEFVKWTGASDNEATDVTIKYAGIDDGYSLKLFVNTKKAEEPVKPITVKIVDAKGNAIAKEFQVTPVNGKYSVIGDILTQRWKGDWKDSYEFVTAKSDEKGGTLSLSTNINAGDTLVVTLKAKSTSTDNTNNGTTNKFPYKVYLHIFKDNKVDDPAKTINITEGIALDGKVTLDEVKTVVKNYYTAKTSDGIKYDGMYLAEGNWVGNFVNDTKKYDTISDTNEMRKTREVHINVMITNANAKSSEKADKTNPKTGDMIFIPVIFMVVSSAAIAGVYFYNKKRSAR
ncbi:MAG: hypothetical protein EGQ10_04355 [Clostridiales bacterium]|nr:hypothetical protein [Clostridiales bacterium]